MRVLDMRIHRKKELKATCGNDELEDQQLN
jgi:hypothetical protein